MEKIHIEKNTVQETLVIPLYARKLCTELYPNLFCDRKSTELIERLDYDFSTLEKKSAGTMQRFGALEVAMRQNDLTYEVRNYLELHPKAAVVNLGCGLDQTGENCDNGMCRIYNLDLPDVISVRNQLLPETERVCNLGVDLNDTVWFDKIDTTNGAVFFAAGVFYYFQRDKVRSLFTKMAECFSGGRLVFDTAGRQALKLMIKTWVKQANIQDVDAFFYVEDLQKDIGEWLQNADVSGRGYMLGYNNLKDKSVSGLFRLLSKVGDEVTKMRIVKIEFHD